MTFEEMFYTATHNKPYRYQIRLATDEVLPDVLHVPTGLGKTAAISLNWVWRRRYADAKTRAQTPRRLIYCLPQRVLVEQTYREIRVWLQRLNELQDVGPTVGTSLGTKPLKHPVSVHLLMGGNVDNSWELYPERDAILIGTQDQLLSRALNRAYGASRYKSPVHYALLSNDVLWVVDEMQLADVGLYTSTQLQAFRESMGAYGPTHTIWTSATFHENWLNTVDFRSRPNPLRILRLRDDDQQQDRIQQIVNAKKPLISTSITLGKENAKKGNSEYAGQISKMLADFHVPGTMTLMVVNQVQRAQALYEAVRKAQPEQDVLLIHSRFRAHERKRQLERLQTAEDSDCMVIATQAIEAGVDISAQTLVTEIASWPSLIQRFGRCNRRGEVADAKVVVIDIEDQVDLVRPYSPEDIQQARLKLAKLKDVAPRNLNDVDTRNVQGLVLRRKDVKELFDTSVDLSGADVDISRYIRRDRDVDLQVYWREVTNDTPDKSLNDVVRDELCSVRVNHLRDYLSKRVKGKTRRAWVWDGLSNTFLTVDKADIYPGQTVLLDCAMGGYDENIGFVPDITDPVQPLPMDHESASMTNDQAYDADPQTDSTAVVELHQHLVDVLQEAEELLSNLDFELPRFEVSTSAFWHDSGKSHPVFQKKLNGATTGKLLAKAPFVKKNAEGNERPGFRHELASALAFMAHAGAQKHGDLNISDYLVAYLIAAHHGKVRASIRSVPIEQTPPDSKRNPLFARGVWQGDKLPEVELGNGSWMPETEMDLRVMQLGFNAHGFTSWTSMVLQLLEEYGPFRLAYLEMLVRVADWRASAKEALT